MGKVVGIKLTDEEYERWSKFASEKGFRAPSEMCRHATKIFMSPVVGSVMSPVPTEHPISLAMNNDEVLPEGDGE
jgi:hypothetical protein